MIAEAITQKFRVSVRPDFLDDHSEIEKRRFLWAYTIEITNEGDIPATLQSRHWFIKNGYEITEEVKGPGVIGKQPRILPGETFEYTSMCPLTTQCGEMHGYYVMRDDAGNTFQIEIPVFTLFVPALNN